MQDEFLSYFRTPEARAVLNKRGFAVGVALEAHVLEAITEICTVGFKELCSDHDNLDAEDLCLDADLDANTLREKATIYVTFNITDYPDCCALKIISNMSFGYTDKPKPVIFKELYGFVMKGIVYTQTDLHTAELQYTTIPKQVNVIAALKVAGFKPVSACKNPNSRHVVTTWSNVLHKAPAPRAPYKRTKAATR